MRLGVLLAASLALAAQPRFPQRTLPQTQGAERALAERFLKETRSGLSGPWNIMLRSPAMSEHLLNLYNYYRQKSALPKPLMELAILTVAREWSVPFVWSAHYPLAIKEGLRAETLEELRQGKRPGGLTAEQGLTYDFTTELCRQHTLGEETFLRTKEGLGEKNIVDLTGLIGAYISIGALLNVGDVKGAEQPGPDRLSGPR
ncbi:MAG TPA: hypothetical protein VFQ91_10345 [Bryobacteraceae bacterium]|nr:hypothetical protein [Bryobacteraceae bacterium]